MAKVPCEPRGSSASKEGVAGAVSEVMRSLADENARLPCVLPTPHVSVHLPGLKVHPACRASTHFLLAFLLVTVLQSHIE